MRVIIAATKKCHHCPILERELKSMKIPYEVLYIEDNPELVEKYKIQRSPVLIVNDKIAFYGMPGLKDLREFFGAAG